MDQEIILIREKRKNIYLLFSSFLFIIVATYLMINSITNKVIATINDARVEYRPVVKNLNDSAGVAGAGVKEIAESGQAVIKQFSQEIPKTVSDSLAGAKKEYDVSQKEVVHEYQDLKSVVTIDYQQLKQELTQFKVDMRKDIDWVKTELGQWRTLIAWVAFAFGLILTLMSIQDILENTRWFISFVKDTFKRKEEKIAS